jgi:hypothetical protein
MYAEILIASISKIHDASAANGISNGKVCSPYLTTVFI